MSSTAPPRRTRPPLGIGWPGCSSAARRGCCAASRRGCAAAPPSSTCWPRRTAAPLGVDRPGRSVVLPLVTRTTPPPPPGPRQASCDAALIGTWTWQPNRIGLDWFLESVVPALPPDFRVEIAGQQPAGVKSDSPTVAFVGRVADAAAFVRRAAVVPLCSRAGTGVQLKTLETFELGLPAVATTRSLRGIDSLPDNCIVADDPQQFASALVRQVRRPPGDADGRNFYFRQRAALDRALGVGLSCLAAGQRAAA